jgi:hypothetical protein
MPPGSGPVRLDDCFRILLPGGDVVAMPFAALHCDTVEDLTIELTCAVRGLSAEQQTAIDAYLRRARDAAKAKRAAEDAEFEAFMAKDHSAA